MWYIYNGKITNLIALDLYIEYIHKSDGYCPDIIQEDKENNYWIIFRCVTYQSWLQFPYELRFRKTGDEILKDQFKTGSELFMEQFNLQCTEDGEEIVREFF